MSSAQRLTRTSIEFLRRPFSAMSRLYRVEEAREIHGAYRVLPTNFIHKLLLDTIMKCINTSENGTKRSYVLS